MKVLIQAMQQVLPSVEKFDKVKQSLSEVIETFDQVSMRLPEDGNGTLEQSDLDRFLNETVTSFENAAGTEEDFIKVFVDIIWPFNAKLKTLFLTMLYQLKIALHII